MLKCFSIVLGVIVLPLMAAGMAQAEIQPDFLMDRDPTLEIVAPLKKYNPATRQTWLQTLKRPEIDLQRMAADTIAEAHKSGVPELMESVPLLETILTAETSHPVARFAAARALIALESQGSCDKLLKASQDQGADLRHLIEPELARWNFGPAKVVWTKRLTSDEGRPRDLILAIRGLGETRETSALPQLKAIAMDRLWGPDVRLTAAAAAGQLVDTGLEQDAAGLAHSPESSIIVDRLCAIRFLARHENDASRALLTELAVHTEPCIAAAALRRLNEIDPALVLPLAESAMKTLDPHVRQQGAHAYLSLPTAERIAPVSLLLDDNHPDVRKHVRENFFRLASNAELNEPIRDTSMKVLAGTRWQGQEQASLLLGALEHVPASMRLVELLESRNERVMVASAWALRKIADPQSVPGMLEQVKRKTVIRKERNTDSIDHQVAHLFEACGKMCAKQAIPLMKDYIPKDPRMGERSRSAAIWALGGIHEATPDEALCKALFDRIMDAGLIPPESFLVSEGALALARMKDVSHAADLRKLLVNGTPNSNYGMALRWSVKELTNEEMPLPTTPVVWQGVWFLDVIPPNEAN